MPPEGLSSLAESILLAVWKLQALGSRSVLEEAVRSKVSVPADEFNAETGRLSELGFLTRQEIDQKPSLSLTALGLAILRQVEEDNLQELK